MSCCPAIGCGGEIGTDFHGDHVCSTCGKPYANDPWQAQEPYNDPLQDAGYFISEISGPPIDTRWRLEKDDSAEIWMSDDDAAVDCVERAQTDGHFLNAVAFLFAHARPEYDRMVNLATTRGLSVKHITFYE